MPWPFSSFVVPGVNGPRLVRSVAPAEEPVTLAEAKAWLKVDTTADDELITELITAAREHLEELTSRSFVATTWVSYWDTWPRLGTYAGAGVSREIELPVAPLVSVSAVKYLDAAGVEQTLAGASYTVEGALHSSRFGRLWLNADASLPDMGDFPGALRVTFVAGAADAAAAPALAKVAIKQMLALWYESARQGVNIGNIVNALPWSGEAIINLLRVRSIS